MPPAAKGETPPCVSPLRLSAIAFSPEAWYHVYVWSVMILEALDKLQRECLSCRGCPLCQGRHNVVFGVGDPESELMFIGEGPGEQEDLRGEPFVGPAGKLLDDMLEMIDLDRSRVYIANVVKCRPPRNRDPLNEEQAACRHWLDAQRDLIRP